MPDKKKDPSERKKIVVEEVVSNDTPVITEPEPQIDNQAATTEVPEEKEYEVEHVVHEHQTPTEKPVEAPRPQVFPIERPSMGPSPLLIIIPGLFLLGGLLGGIVFYQSKVSQNPSQAPTSTPETIVEEVTPSPSPAASDVDLTEFSIKVLNGSGTAGEAGKAQDLLEEEGFEVSSTGNASNYSYTKTVIQAKSTVSKEFLTKLSETLSESYAVESKTQSLSASSADDVVVIVGSTKN